MRGPGLSQLCLALKLLRLAGLDFLIFIALPLSRYCYGVLDTVFATVLQPFWDRAGFALGAVTALIGPEAAMACTAAIETEIDDHYSKQLDRLHETGEDPELAGMIEQFRDDEREHRDAALAAGAERAPAYPLLSGLIRLGCRTAIRISERV